MFSEKDVEVLSQNPYIKKVSSKAITYSEEFKEIFAKLYQNGKRPIEIFKECGLPSKVIGQSRISSFSNRIKKKLKEGKGLNDTRREKSGRPQTRELSMEDKIKKLEHEIKYKDQQIEFLKKINFIDKRAQWKVSQKKSTK